MRIHGERPDNVGQTASTQAPADRGRTGWPENAAPARPTASTSRTRRAC